ncbi:hypothetical protein Tco_0330936 [Tanacetum coccineum]
MIAKNNIKENLYLEAGLLAKYEDEGWNDAVIPDEGSLNYENPDIKQLLGIMERKVDTLMKDAISLMRRSEGVFWIKTNEMYQPPLEPSHQEEFEHVVMNFILDQEERVKQLEEYIKVIIGDFMQLSLKVTRRLKDKIREEGGGGLGALEVNPLPPKEYQLRKKFECLGYSRVVCTKCAMMLLLGAAFTPGTSSIRNSSPAKVLLKPSLSLSTKTLSPTPNEYDPNHLGVRFRLRGEQKEISLLELGWRIGLYSERQSRESATLSGLRKGVTVKANHLLLGFWPTIGDDGFNVGNTKVASIRYPRVKLAPCCIATTIAGRKESSHRVTEIDLFHLYCIYSDEVICNIPYWLAKYMVGMREKSLICGGMFVTRIARSYGLLTNEMMRALSVEPSPHVFKKNH